MASSLLVASLYLKHLSYHSIPIPWEPLFISTEVFQSCSLRNLRLLLTWKNWPSLLPRGPAILQPCTVCSTYPWSIALIKKSRPIAGYSVFSRTPSSPWALCGFSTWVLLKKRRGQEKESVCWLLCQPGPSFQGHMALVSLFPLMFNFLWPRLSSMVFFSHFITIN